MTAGAGKRLHADHAAWAPAGALSPWVELLSGYEERHAGPVWHRGLPGAALTMVIGVGPGISVTMPDGRGPSAHRAFVAGLHTGAAHVTNSGEQRGVQLSLRPEGVRALFGMPAASLAGQVVELEDLLTPRQLARLLDRVGTASGPRAMAAAADQELTALAATRTRPRPDPAAAATLALLRRTNGAMPITDLAEQVGWSRRTLQRRVLAEVGIAPKMLARLMRLQATLARISPPAAVAPAPDRGAALARLAVRLGFSDHAHLTREVRALTGATPTRLLAERAVGGSLPLPADA